MFSRRKAAKRFSLLLLEEEESYVADWVATCKWPSNISGNWQGAAALPGRLRLCTKSLFFDPDDVRVPIVRLDFAAVVQLEAESMQACVVGVNKVTKMKANMADEPYVVEKGATSTWVFSLTYAKLDSFMPLAQEQLVISRLPTAERLQMLDASVKAREDAAAFDTSRLVEFSERLLWEGPVLGLSPLVREPGRLAITDTRVYFQPLHNISGDMLVRSHPLTAVAAVARRRSSLRPIGLELFMISPGLEPHLQDTLGRLSGPFWDAASAFFTFRSQQDRDKAFATLTAQPQLGVAVSRLTPHPPAADSSSSSSSNGTGSGSQEHESQVQHAQAQQLAAAGSQPHTQQLAAAGALLEANSTWLHRVMMAWQLGRISNFDYLLYLNLAAGRSFNDLAQWPVFPWVLRDYSSAELDLSRDETFRDLSKPMGALTPSRLEVFRRRYHDMDSMSQHIDAGGGMPEPFMYGTHYSTPGYVMYWLVRAAPGHMLRLQSGKFDAPDRLFNSLKDSWESATTSTTDVKELIPEFYMPGGDFLVNSSQLAFGVRQNGQPVNNVQLPPWASGPDDMLAKHRAALEAPYVSAHLHEWIDLIFGHKQTGPAAVEADNIFYHLTYEGAVDISKVESIHELRALETQINEFGQTPKQLFAHPHPPRLTQPPAPDPATVFNQTHVAAAASTPPAGVHASSSNTRSSPEPGFNPAALQGRQSPGLAAAAAGSSGSSSASKVRLKGGGEDAAGGAICFALLSTILAAAAPEVETAAAAAGLGAGVGAGGGAQAEGGGVGVGAQAEGGGLQLSPVGSGDLSSAAPCSISPAGLPAHSLLPPPALSKQQQQQQQGSKVSSGSGSPTAAAQPSGQQGIRGMLSKLSVGAAAAADSVANAAATVASAVQSSASSGRSGSPVPQPPTGGDGKQGGSMLASLSWMQQQLAEGLSLRSSSSTSSSNVPQGPSAAAASGTLTKAPSSSSSSMAKGSSSTTASSSKPWPKDLPEKLLVRKALKLQSDPLTAVAAAPDGSALFVAGHNGLLRVLDTAHLATHRSMKLENTDLMCISLLPTAGSSAAAAPAAAAAAARAESPAGGSSSSSKGAWEAHLPMLLAGAQSGRVLAYAATAGRVVGSWAAHDDAVSSLLQLSGAHSSSSNPTTTTSSSATAHSSSDVGSVCRFATASWDCSVKVWDAAEGRQPWSSTLPLPLLELRDLESGVWALAGSASGQLLVTGTEEGVVAAWDLRTRQQIWSTQVSSDYVGGLSILPGGNYVAAAAADGTLSLLEWRRAGETIASASCGSPVRCCSCDGHLLLCGTESGQLLLWNLDQMTGQGSGGSGKQGFSLAGPDGLYPALSCPSKAPVNCVAVAVGGPGGQQAEVAAALDDGSLVLFSSP